MKYRCCDVCKSEKNTKKFTLEGFTVVTCSQCGFEFVNPMLDAEELEKIYDANYYSSPFEDRFFGYANYLEDEECTKKTFVPRLRRIEGFVKKGSILDVGCATGVFLDLARARGWKTKGTDVSEYAIKHAREKKGLDVQVGTLESVSLENGFFQAVTAFDVIEHVPEPDVFIRQINDLLVSGGVIALTTPDAGSFLAKRLGSRWEEYRRIREHVSFFSRKTLQMLLERNGFKVVWVETAGRHFKLGELCKRLSNYSVLLSKVASVVVHMLFLKNIHIYIDPRYKMTMYARKVAVKRPEKLSVIIPIYNEEKTIEKIVRAVKDVAIPLEKEIILVDDGSTDGTKEILNRLSGVRVAVNKKNQGKGFSIRRGLSLATGDVMVIQDADLEYNPQNYISLLTPILNKKSKVVFGSRFLKKSSRKKCLFPTYYLGNRALSFFTSFLFMQKVSDMETCYKMFTREVFEGLKLTRNRFDIEPEITAKIIKTGFKILEIPIDYSPRKFSEGKKIGWKDGVIAAWVILSERLKK